MLAGKLCLNVGQIMNDVSAVMKANCLEVTRRGFYNIAILDINARLLSDK